MLTTSFLGDLVPLDFSSVSQQVAYEGMMLRVEVGSAVNGTSVDNQSDFDEMGVCVEPPATVIGSRKFEHYTFRTQPMGATSGPGDLDLTVYSLRKFAYLAAAGNPTVLTPLFVPDKHVLYINDFGRELRVHRDMFISKQAGARFKGYLHSQRQGLLGFRSGGTNNHGRQDIRDKYGFDTKFAMHMVRLGLQGVELLKTGSFTLPVPEPDLSWLRDLRRGLRTKEEALERAADLESQIEALMVPGASPLPDHPRQDAIDFWLESVHRRHWGW